MNKFLMFILSLIFTCISCVKINPPEIEIGNIDLESKPEIQNLRAELEIQSLKSKKKKNDLLNF